MNLAFGRESAMIGVVVTSYERPAYVRATLRSLARTEFTTPTSIVLVDDGSRCRTTLRLLAEFRLEGADVFKIFRPRLTDFGVNDCLRIGWDFLLQECGCRYLANLDSDVLVTPDWLTRLSDLYRRQRTQGPLLVTGFNTLRHPVHRQHADYCEKASCGGINLFFDADFYQEIIRDSLADYGWDWEVVRALQARGYPLLCSTPSVVQHIGKDGYHSDSGVFDRACDFPQPPGRWPWPFSWRRAG